MKLIKEFFRKEWKAYVLIIFLLAVVDLSQVIIPIFTKNAINAVGLKETKSLLFNSLMIVIIGILIVTIRYLYNNLLRFQVLKFDYNLKDLLFNKFLYLKKEDLQKFEIGDLMARVTNDTMAVRMFLIMGFLGIVDVFMLGFTTFASMFIMSKRLTLATVWPLIFLIPITLNFGKKIHKTFRKVQMIFADMTVRVREVIGGIRVVKAFVREDYYLGLFKNVNEQYLFENLKLVKLDGFLDPTINFFINFSLVNLVIFGSIFVIKNSVQIGTVVAFFQYILTLAWPVMAIGFSIALTQRARASLGRINEILDITEREEERKNYFDLKGDIVIKDLSFSYEDSNRKALDGVSMNIRCSELLGITGLPGSGKTTLINLLLRIYEPEAGEIYFNGYDITQLQLNVMRSQITFVPQEPFLFGDTILNNLKIGRENATFEEVQNAAEVAQIHDDILKFPNSYDTVVGEQGITLSGGEKQRISIARAILANKSFMVFDDPLSAVDIDTERQIIKHLKDFLKENNTTTLLVSQRVSALLAADHIAVFEQGRVIEYGTPDELMEKKGYFYHLYKRQLLEETEV